MPTPIAKIYGHQIVIQTGVTVDETTTWTNYMLLNSDRSFSGSSNQIEDPQYDLDDLSKPASINRRGESIDTSFSGTGMVHATIFPDTMEWYSTQEARLCRVKFGETLTVEGFYILANVEIQAENKQAATITASFVQADTPTFS